MTTTISRIDLVGPVIRTNNASFLGNRFVNTTNRSAPMTVEQRKEIEDLQEKLRILSKGYYDLREELRAKEEENVGLRTQVDKVKQEMQQREIIHQSLLKDREKTLEKRMKIKIPSIDKLNNLREKVHNFKQKWNKSKREAEDWKKKYEDYTKSTEYVRDNYEKLQEECATFVETIDELKEQLLNAQTFEDRMNFEKRDREVKMTNRIFKLNRKVESHKKEYDVMKKKIKEQEKKLIYYKEWMQQTQRAQQKIEKQHKKMHDKHFSLKTALSNEYRNSKSREDIIEKQRKQIYLLRQQLRMRSEPKQNVDNSHFMESQFFKTVKSQVDSISDSLNMSRRTGPI